MNHLLRNVLMIIQIGVSCKWTNDSQRFLLEHLGTINKSPSHIYHSALPFTPPSTWLQECYHSEIPQEVKVAKGLPAKWGTCSHTVSLGTAVFGVSHWNNTVAVASGHRDIIILDAITGSQTAILSGHTDQVWSVTFSFDGRSLVSGSDDKTVKLWDMQTGGAIRTFSGHTEDVCSVSISVDSTTIVSGSYDKTIRLWDAQTGECCHVIKQPTEVLLVKFSPMNPQHFLSQSNYKILQWNISGNQAGPIFDGHLADFSPDGTQLFSHCEMVATIQNPSSGAVTTKFPLIGDNAGYPCFSPDGRMIAIGGEGIIYVWSITNSEPHLVGTFVGHNHLVPCLAFSSPSSLISGSYDQSVKFWKIGDQSTDFVGTDTNSTPLTSATIMSITLQAKNNLSITSDSKGVVKTWDILTGVCKASFQTPAEGANKRDVQMINGRLVLAWHAGGQIKIWDVEKEDLLAADELRDLQDIKISEDGSRIFSVNPTVIQVHSIQTGEIMYKAEIGNPAGDIPSLTVNGSRVWVHYLATGTQVWDFGTSDSSPVQLPNMNLEILHPSCAVLWDASLFCIKEKATGKVVFWLPKMYGKPVGVQWNDQYLVTSFISGEVLVLDCSYVLPL